MRKEDKFLCLSLLIGVGVTVAAMALPLWCPSAPKWMWGIMFFGGLIIAAYSFLYLVYELLIRPHLDKEIELVPLIMIICGILLIVGGFVVYHLSDNKLKLLNIDVSGTIDAYPPNINIGGVSWKQSYADIRIYLLNETDRDYNDLDISLTTDLTIAQIGQITNLPNVSFIPIEQGLLFFEGRIKLEDTTGKISTMPIIKNPNGPVYVPTYRMRCPTLPRRSHIGLVLAIVAMNPIINGNFPAKLFGKKRLPKWVQIEGHYQDLGQERIINYRKYLP